MNVETKKCRQCNEIKFLSEFHADKTKKMVRPFAGNVLKYIVKITKMIGQMITKF